MKAEITKKLDEGIQLGITANKLQGFEKAYTISDAYDKLSNALTPEYMKPIMKLQNNKLGFKTDKPGGYDENTVKRCLIEAVLTGVQPVGNQFNIIADNCYITKEGFGYLLKNSLGLNYEIIPQLPRINPEKTSAAIVMKITWSVNGGKEQTRDIDFPIRMNKFMGTDAVIGKATRKARAWLYNTVSDNEVLDGDAGEVTIEAKAEVVTEKTNAPNPFNDKSGDIASNAIIDFEKENRKK